MTSASAQARDGRGRFAGGTRLGGFGMASSASVAGGIAAPVKLPDAGKRSLTRGEGWQRIGTKIAAIPSSYTGLASRELPIGSFVHFAFKSQTPPTMSAVDHAELSRRLVNVVQVNRPGAIEKGTERGLVPPGTDRHTLHRAYNHGAMLAMHDFGVADYDFRMDDHLKSELTPLTGFIRYVRRRVRDHMLAGNKGAWKPYRQAFGRPFKDSRRDKLTGEVRLRMRPNDVLVKRARVHGGVAPGVIEAMPPGLVHLLLDDGADGLAPRAPHEVEAMLPVAHRVLATYDPLRAQKRAAAGRHARTRMVGDLTRPLHHALARTPKPHTAAACSDAWRARRFTPGAA